MRVLQVADSEWAIGALAKTIKNENSHHKIDVMFIHPKEYRADNDKWNKIFYDKVTEFKPDLIHFHYWDTAKYLSELDFIKGIPKILTHHNQKNLLSHTWNFDKIITHTQKAKEILNGAGYDNVEVIQHGIDIEHFKYNESYDSNNRQLGYTGRIVPWKNLYDILKTAKELDTEVVMMGKIDKADYWNKCLEFSDQMDIRFGTDYKDQPSVYHEMAVYIGNSDDNIEEGTLGLLEAMACGIPVITTPSGEAKDIIVDGKNGILIEFNNQQNLKSAVKRFLEMTVKEKDEMRRFAWDTVRKMSKVVMARKYEKLYYKLVYKNDLVSVIIPTCKRPDTIEKVIEAYEKQTYRPIELVIVIDDVMFNYLDYVEKLKNKDKYELPIKLSATENDGYGLAQARNQGIFLAGGHYLVFNDDRFEPEEKAVEVFIEHLKRRKGLYAVWGNKGYGQKDFIENFFAIRKAHIVQAGMFNERINEYGGQSQEVRERLRKQGFILEFNQHAKASAIFGTHSRSKRKYELFRTKEKLWLLGN